MVTSFQKPLLIVQALAIMFLVGGLFGPLDARGAAVNESKKVGDRFVDRKGESVASFRRHVVPLMSRVGCSGRACHGSFSGQGGFQLSLFGYDFEKDYKQITADTPETESYAHRIDKGEPDESLILLKSTLLEKHEGKQVIKEDSWEYNLIAKWVEQGAKIDVQETGKFDRLEIIPSEIVFDEAGQSEPVKVLAHWKDGTVEDVTQITRFRTNDEGVAEVDEHGVITALTAGDTHVVAFYDNGVKPIPVMLAVSDRVGARYPDVPTPTTVDQIVVDKLRKVGIVPSDVCTDQEFLRRVHIDLTGTLPTAGQVTGFLEDTGSDKRGRKIDELLKTPGYAAWWSTKLCDITGNNAKLISDRNFRTVQARQWYEWINTRVTANVPYDEIVAGIVLGTSRTSADQDYEGFATEMSSYVHKDEPEDFSERETMPHFWARSNVKKPEERALSFSYAFLGVRLECAQCHKHPFDRWTQQDFKSFQAFFEPIRYGNNTRPQDKGGLSYKALMADVDKVSGYKRGDNRKIQYAEIKKRAYAGEASPWQEVFVNQPRKLSAKQIAAAKRRNPDYDARVLTPKILGGEHVLAAGDPREPLMEWLRDSNNEYFARAFVNRAWANYFGRGIVEPADDMNLANPPSNKALLDYLADGFVNSGFDMQWVHRQILRSDAYQRSWQTNATNKLDEKNFSHMVLRRMPAEVVADSIAQAVGSPRLAEQMMTDMEMRSTGPKAASGAYAKSAAYALTVFGKPVRETTCDCERSNDPTLLQTIYTRNDPNIWALFNQSKTSWLKEVEGQDRVYLSAQRKYESQVASYQRALKTYEARRADYKKRIPKNPSYANKLKQLKKPRAPKEPVSALDHDALITQVFLRTVSRYPHEHEIAQAREDMAKAETAVLGLRELMWTMLNTKEFVVNH